MRELLLLSMLELVQNQREERIREEKLIGIKEVKL